MLLTLASWRVPFLCPGPAKALLWRTFSFSCWGRDSFLWKAQLSFLSSSSASRENALSCSLNRRRKTGWKKEDWIFLLFNRLWPCITHLKISYSYSQIFYSFKFSHLRLPSTPFFLLALLMDCSPEVFVPFSPDCDDKVMDQLKIGSTLSKNLLDLIMGPSTFSTILPKYYDDGRLGQVVEGGGLTTELLFWGLTFRLVLR